MTSGEVFQIVSAILGLLTISFGVVKILDKKAGERQAQFEQSNATQIDDLKESIKELKTVIAQTHSRINDVKDSYVKQEVHERDINMIRSSISEFRSEVRHELTNGMTLFNQSLTELRKDLNTFLIEVAARQKKGD